MIFRQFGMRRLWEVLLLLMWLLMPGAAAADWNVADTGQPYTEAEFTVTEGTWMSVDVSPDGKTLVFDLLGDLYAMPSAGGTATLVRGGPAMQRSPRFSPDGSKILYISDAGGSDNIWMANADGSKARPVSHETVQLLTGPAWGPKGQYIAAARLYATVDKLHSSELRLYDVDGGTGRVLVPTPSSGENVHEAEFSPDGRTLYYTEKITPPSASVVYIDADHINYAIQRRDLETGETEQLIAGFGGATTPRVSPDGKRLAFIRRVKTKTVLFVYDIASRRQALVYDGLDRDDQNDFINQGQYYPEYGWFPDNIHVAIWGKGKLYKVNMDTGAAQEILFRVTAHHRITVSPHISQPLAPETFRVRAIRHIALAPGDRSMVFEALGHLWWQEMPKGTPKRLSDATSVEAEPSFSPDGQQLAYVTWEDEKGGRLKLARPNGKHARILFASAGIVRQPAFSRNGKRLVFKIGEGNKCIGGYHAKPGLYWISANGGEAHFITGAGNSPQFSPDGTRVYYTVQEYAGHSMVTRLESVNLDGLDKRIHARTPNADTGDLRISPDLQWIAFKADQQYYVMAYHQTGSPVTVDAKSGAVPVAALATLGGYGLTWSADSTTLHWALGPEIYRAEVAKRFKAGSAVPKPEMAPEIEIDLHVKTDVPQGVIAFTNGRIITMKDGGVIEHGTVVVKGNKIAAIGPAGDVAIPDGAKVIDVTGKTLMPGFIDMHGHIDNCYYSSAGITAQKLAPRYADLAYGVTTNYDPYTSELPSFAITEMTKAGVMVGPRSINVGKVAYGRAGKPDQVYVPINSYEDARRFMARKKALGDTVVKSYRQPMRQQRQMLIKAGREAGIMIDVEGESHFYNNLTMVLDGHMSLEHNMPVATYYDDVVQLMAHSNMSHTPTLIVLFGELMGENYMYENTRTWDDPKARMYIKQTTSGYSPLATPYAAPPYVRGATTIHAVDKIWDIGFRSVAKSIKKLDDAGVVINAGSHGQIAGLAMDWEMWLLSQGGMSNMHVLRAGTLNGAKTLGIDKQIGSLEVGKLADLIVLDANPLDDIHNTNTVRYTMVNGRLYNSLSMNEIGNRNRPRDKFYWELPDYRGPDYQGIGWDETWAHH